MSSWLYASSGASGAPNDGDEQSSGQVARKRYEGRDEQCGGQRVGELCVEGIGVAWAYRRVIVGIETGQKTGRGAQAILEVARE